MSEEINSQLSDKKIEKMENKIFERLKKCYAEFLILQDNDKKIRMKHYYGKALIALDKVMRYMDGEEDYDYDDENEDESENPRENEEVKDLSPPLVTPEMKHSIIVGELNSLSYRILSYRIDDLETLLKSFDKKWEMLDDVTSRVNTLTRNWNILISLLERTLKNKTDELRIEDKK